MNRRDFLKAAAASGGSSQEVVVCPQEIDALLANPGMGWQTFHCFADEDKNLAGLPSSSAYFRFCWKEIEPREGEIRFDFLDGLLACARRRKPGLAKKTFCDLVDEFKAGGICECVAEGYRQLESYVVSATNPLGAMRRLKQQRKKL